ncbi:hypothetical protein K0M31_006795 [Melipona bicolor]|uniref:Uncharacterized protein n=1 Tax=Melipona bicolor TaxID=60889 RepID=A0AA40KL55_9HYME|nr:hypothetical protein K0M31_006795 [Melipona bicolor]
MERLKNEIGEEETCKTLVMWDREIQLQVQYDKISRSKYNARYKFISCYRRPEYLTKKGNRDSQRLIARARVGNVEEYSKYWLKEEERRCRLCERQSGTLKHLIEECEKVERCEHSVEQVLGGSTCERIVKWLRTVEKSKIAKEKEWKNVCDCKKLM